MGATRRRKLLLWSVVGVLSVGMALLVLWLGEPAPPRQVRLATGVPDGAYHEYGVRMARSIAAHRGVTVEILTTRGSVENLRLLLDGGADVAFVQGGVLSALRPTLDPARLAAIARVFSEPLWAFYRGDAEVGHLRDLRTPRRRIAVGAEGSGTLLVALEVLRVNGIDERSADLLRLDPGPAAAALLDGTLDVLFFVGAPEADVVERLLRAPGVRVVDFTDHRAYAHLLPFLTAVEVAPGALSLTDGLPARPLVLLAPSATLVARADLHPRVVEAFTVAALKLFRRGNVLDLAGTFPSATHLEVEQHDAARRFMEEGESWTSRHLPYWLVRLLPRLQLLLIPLLTVVVPAVKLLPWLLRLRLLRLIRRRYEDLRRIEDRLRAAPSIEALRAELAATDALTAEVIEAARDLRGGEQGVIYDWRLHVELVRREAEARLAARRQVEAAAATASGS